MLYVWRKKGRCQWMKRWVRAEMITLVSLGMGFGKKFGKRIIGDGGEERCAGAETSSAEMREGTPEDGEGSSGC